MTELSSAQKIIWPTYSKVFILLFTLKKKKNLLIPDVEELILYHRTILYFVIIVNLRINQKLTVTQTGNGYCLIQTRLAYCQHSSFH